MVDVETGERSQYTCTRDAQFEQSLKECSSRKPVKRKSEQLSQQNMELGLKMIPLSSRVHGRNDLRPEITQEMSAVAGIT